MTAISYTLPAFTATKTAPVVEVKKGWDWEKIMGNVSQGLAVGTQAYAGIMQARAAREITKVNLQRVGQGKDPLDASTITAITPAPQVQLGLAAEDRQAVKSTLTPLLLVALGLGAFLVFRAKPAQTHR